MSLFSFHHTLLLKSFFLRNLFSFTQILSKLRPNIVFTVVKFWKAKKNKTIKKNLSRITFEFFKLISVFQRKTKHRCCQRLRFVLFDVSQLSRHVPNCNGKNETYKSQTLNVIVNRLGKHLHPENILLIE